MHKFETEHSHVFALDMHAVTCTLHGRLMLHASPSVLLLVVAFMQP